VASSPDKEQAMPVITSANSIIIGGAPALVLDNDSLTIDNTGFLISTTHNAVELQNVQEVTIAGTVWSNATGFFAALAQLENVDLDLTVDPTGTVHGRSIGFYAAFNADIDNHGKISASDGAAIAHSGTAFYIDNFGLISSAESHAILMTGAGIHTINNSGVISGKTVGAFAITSSNATAVDNVGNFGAIHGNLSLGGGDDSYSGAAGRLFGTVFLGAGEDEATGGAIQDKFDGGDQNDILIGNGGADTLTGGAHNDRLTGGVSIDILTGGLGNDIFVFNVGLAFGNRDTVMDFNVGNDTAHLENAIFKKVGPVGALKAAAFRAGTKALDADDRIIYNKASGALSYDADGVGGAAQKIFAVIDNNPTLTHHDFRVI
jgi:Ca2+-binding RTX toxin-like protein